MPPPSLHPGPQGCLNTPFLRCPGGAWGGKSSIPGLGLPRPGTVSANPDPGRAAWGSSLSPRRPCSAPGLARPGMSSAQAAVSVSALQGATTARSSGILAAGKGASEAGSRTLRANPRRTARGTHREWIRHRAQAADSVAKMDTVTEQGTKDGSSAVSPEAMAELTQFLQDQLPRLFTPEGMATDKFEEVVEFEDPITKYDSLGGYLFNIAMLRALFSPVFILHSVYQSGLAELTTRWTMKMYFRILPWQPEIVFTGLSIYGINPRTNRFLSHKDIWDSVQDNAYFSAEGLRDLIQQSIRVYRPPQELGSPNFIVALRKAVYEVRLYDGFTVAQTACPFNMKSVGTVQGSSEAKSLQRWLSDSSLSNSFRIGKPFMWAVAPSTSAKTNEVDSPSVSVCLQQPLHPASAAPAIPLTAPSSSDSVSVLELPPRPVAVLSFAGAGTPDKFEANEALLRSLLLRDGLQPGGLPGTFTAACYQDSFFLPPFFQRNEVMIPLDGFSWPPQ